VGTFSRSPIGKLKEIGQRLRLADKNVIGFTAAWEEMGAGALKWLARQKPPPKLDRTNAASPFSGAYANYLLPDRRNSEASISRTSDWEIPNCLAMREGVTAITWPRFSATCCRYAAAAVVSVCQYSNTVINSMA
jgi:hypothetical protein